MPASTHPSPGRSCAHCIGSFLTCVRCGSYRCALHVGVDVGEPICSPRCPDVLARPSDTETIAEIDCLFAGLVQREERLHDEIEATVVRPRPRPHDSAESALAMGDILAERHRPEYEELLVKGRALLATGVDRASIRASALRWGASALALVEAMDAEATP